MMYSQGNPTLYEIELDKYIQKENVEFYSGLNKIINEFEQHLISQGIIEKSDYDNYARLLKEIGSEKEKELNISYNLDATFQGLLNRLNLEESSLYIQYAKAKGTKDLNSKTSKSLLFNEKVSALIKNKNKLTRSEIANLILDVYDSKDYELPLVKLKIIRFLDPNYDSVIYSYAEIANIEE